MSTIEVFEPALCCNTGVCGDDVDQALVTFSADLDWVRSQGGDIARFNLASEPLAFAEREPVTAFLQVAGSEGLPLVLVDEVTVLTSSTRFPARAREMAVAQAMEVFPTPPLPVKNRKRGGASRNFMSGSEPFSSSWCRWCRWGRSRIRRRWCR